MVEILEDIDLQLASQSYADKIDVGIPEGDLAQPDYSILYAKPNATTLSDHEDNSYNPAVSVSDMHFRSFVIDADDDDTNQAGTTESRYDEETEEDKIHKKLSNMVENSWGHARPNYTSSYAVDLSIYRIREVSAHEGLADGCHHHFNGAAQDHIDVDGNEIRVHRVEDHTDDPSGRQTAQELIEEAQATGEIKATGDLADNDTLCEADPTSEICTATPFQFTP